MPVHKLETILLYFCVIAMLFLTTSWCLSMQNDVLVLNVVQSETRYETDKLFSPWNWNIFDFLGVQVSHLQVCGCHRRCDI